MQQLCLFIQLNNTPGRQRKGGGTHTYLTHKMLIQEYKFSTRWQCVYVITNLALQTHPLTDTHTHLHDPSPN